LSTDNFKEGKMSLDPKKTKRYGTNIDAVPLNQMALQLLREEKKFTGTGTLFFKFTEQYGNRTLKKIAVHEKVNIDQGVHNHIGRSTFASLYDQAGGNHRSLMEYMGLTKMETLMKYVHTNKDVISEGIDKMNESLTDI
jgi:integrase